MTPQTLFDLSGVTARIYNLPDRPPFIMDADMATIYGTTTKRINEQVKRNSERFPSEFCFLLTQAEEEAMWSHFATTSTRKRDDVRSRAFTHIGAYALAGVLKTPVAAQVSMIVHRAFAAMEEQALKTAQERVQRLRMDILMRKPVYGKVEMAIRNGWTLETLWRATSYTRLQLETAAADLVAMQIVDQLPAGWAPAQRDLFSSGS